MEVISCLFKCNIQWILRISEAAHSHLGLTCLLNLNDSSSTEVRYSGMRQASPLPVIVLNCNLSGIWEGKDLNDRLEKIFWTGKWTAATGKITKVDFLEYQTKKKLELTPPGKRTFIQVLCCSFCANGSKVDFQPISITMTYASSRSLLISRANLNQNLSSFPLWVIK